MPTFSVDINIKNARQIERMFRKAPAKAAKHLSDAINKSILVIHREALQKNLKFKRPTGATEKSFSRGIVLSNARTLRGAIGPRTHYAVYVHEGTKRIREPNPFLPRILDVARSDIDVAFNRQMDKFVREVARDGNRGTI